MPIKVVATVPRQHNNVWTGKGNVDSIGLERGIVILTMTSGLMQGQTGGFNIEDVIFEVEGRN